MKISFIIFLGFEGNKSNFLFISKDLLPAGELKQFAKFDFHFKDFDKEYSSYLGDICNVKYFLRLTCSKRFNSIIKEQLLWIQELNASGVSLAEVKENTNEQLIKMEVGIDECLHIEFGYNKSKFSLKDVIVGKISFLLVRVKLKSADLEILKKEIVQDAVNEKTIAKIEIMDGSPIKGTVIPIRFFIGGFDIGPTMNTQKFKVKYFLNLVLIDEEGRRYFKQQEIELFC